MANNDEESPWRNELEAVMRGFAGAFLFGAPFLYTMEVWWKGSFSSPPHMLLSLVIAYAALVVLDIRGGFRGGHARTLRRTLADSVEALAIALLASTFGLLLIGVIGSGDGIQTICGQIIAEALPFSIGVGIANSVLHQEDAPQDETDDKPDEVTDDEEPPDATPSWFSQTWKATLADAGASALGAVIIAASISPTDEIPTIASVLTYPWLLILVAASLLLSYIIVFEAEFGRQSERRDQTGFFQSPLSETLVSYLISLGMALLMLWLFRLVRPGDPLSQWVSYTIVLGFPATIGGAAGRLAL
ncbi:MAG: TIGR02587 family membrane protein [Armatimonadota bacterium]